MTSEDIAWVAGIFEADGSLYVDKNGKGGTAFPCLAIGMTDEDTIQKLKTTIGVGDVQGPYPGATDNRKPYWRYRLRNKDAVEKLCELMLPWLSKRRTAKVHEILHFIDMSPRRYARGTRGETICIGLR